MTPHKHAEVIHAFADGKTIQHMISGEWTDWKHDSAPPFYSSCAYRLKPEPVVRYFQMWVTNDARCAVSLEFGPVRPCFIREDGHNVKVTITDGKITAVELL